jgi:hypothetical protein
MENDVVISFSQLLWLIGGITALAAFIKWVSTPFKKIEDHEQRIKVLENQHEERKVTDRYTTKALNAIVNHLIDGNGTDKLREVRDEYQNEIINHL